MADALPRERWILVATVLFVVFGGLFPNTIVIQHSAEAVAVDESIYTSEILNRVPTNTDDSSRRRPATEPIAMSLFARKVEHQEQRPDGVHR